MSPSQSLPAADRFRDALAELATQTASLVTDARGLDEQALRAPSRCHGWTRAHVLAHLRGNADAMVRLAANAADGGNRPMYDSQQARAADIEQRATADGATLADAVESSAAAVADAFAALDPAVLDRELDLGQTRLTVAELPAHRLREVVFHHVDLDAGFGFGDAPADRLQGWLEDAVRRLIATGAAPSMTLVTNERDRFSIGDGAPTVSASRAGALLWISRGIPDDIDAPPAAELPALPTLEGATR